MSKNHEVHDRAHPPLGSGRAADHNPRSESRAGGLKPSMESHGGIDHLKDTQNSHYASELRSKESCRNEGKAQHFERKGEKPEPDKGTDTSPAGASGDHQKHHEHGTNAEHHFFPGAGEPHRFDRPMSKGAHGFGHNATQRSGALRNSGHSGAHRIGKR